MNTLIEEKIQETLSVIALPLFKTLPPHLS